MTTQYTSILKLALPVQGELSGAWGDVVNNNVTSMVEQAVAGLAVINSWSTNSHTLTTANGTTSESRCAVLVADDNSGQPAGAATIICPAATKLYILKNISGQAVTLKTASGTGVAVANGSTSFLFCDGTNVESCQTDIVDATTVDTTNLEVTNIKAKDGTASGTIANSSGVFTINSAVLTTADINAGTIDNAAIGGSTAAAGAFTTLDATGDVTGANFQPDGDTAAGDDAAIGYTSAEGLILTGQGSTNDVTIKNDADADVLEIPTGTTNVTVVGNVTAGGNLISTGTVEPAGDTAAGDNAAIGYTSVEGLILTGQGSTNDVTIKNDADADVIEIPTGTTDVTVVGKFTGGKIVLAATDTDTSNTGSVTIDFSAHQNFVLTLTGNTTLANPSTEAVGQAGVFVFIQDGTGSRTLSLGTDYESPASGGITLSTAANAIDVVPYFVKASGSIQLGAPQLAFG